ncbi:hypothetical protein BG015_008957 [Linnemannia schmuckeri]|uniref:Uncharacterized protein n=1 Tax=Linnemannia schmuckeri TaxID=64567 RepID=A0A9P5VAA7_9FUNG|nr:hypothetical protein BG015_008957 [Linnemannia schmuckeri]
MCRERVVEEETPARLQGYANEYCGMNAVPMLTKSEDKAMYFLENRHLESLLTEVVYAVWSAENYDRAFLFYERDVLRVARGVHGLQVGVDNARIVIEAAPFPEEAILDRRDAPGILFLQRRYFVRSDFPRIRAFVEGQQGGTSELMAIVDEMAI